MESLEQRLRRIARELRVNSKSLSEIIPLLQEAADTIERQGKYIDTLHGYQHERNK